MKDLTHYFTSPTKQNVQKSPEKQSKSTKTSTSNAKTKSPTSNLDKEPNKNAEVYNIKSKKHKKEKLHKKKKRKLSDPLVNNVTDLLETSLNIVSPNTSANLKNKVSKIIELDEKISVDSLENRLIDTEIVCNEKSTKSSNNNSVNKKSINHKTPKKPTSPIENKNDSSIKKEESTPKPNAFQFLMDSRHKVIGANSSGKDKELNSKNDEIAEESQDKLTQRKKDLQEWADRKGASKRKRDYQERGEIIQEKLDKRAKRLKNMLSLSLNNSKSVEDSIGDVKSVKTRKKRVVKRISSTDSENSNITNNVDKENLISEVEETSREVIAVDENAQNNDMSVKRKKTTRKSVLNFSGVVKKLEGKNKPKDKTESLNSIVNEKVIDEIKETKNVGTRRSLRKRVIKNDESSQDSNFEVKTPSKSWKLRIKICDSSNSEQPRFKDDSKSQHKTSNKSNDKKEQNKNDSIQSISSSSCSEDDSDFECTPVKKSVKKNTKVAPVFAKSIPKPKEDPTVIEARKQFLMSGIPESLKKRMEKQQIIEQRDYDIFPKISHVQQLNNSQFWNLPSQNLILQELSPLKYGDYDLKCHKITYSDKPTEILKCLDAHTQKIEDLATIVNQIKSQNPNYPVNKSFKSIHKKSGKITDTPDESNNKKPSKSKKGRKRKSTNSTTSTPIPEITLEHTQWTDKYKPTSSSDIIGNTATITSLRDWLELWTRFSDEINAVKGGGRKRRASTSDSDFESVDGNSRDSVAKLPKNTLILSGPNGSGKTAAVYAICSELGFNVLELNASSKRTGKKLIQDLLEATQSHQVRNNQFNPLNILVQSKTKPIEEPRDASTQKMCVLLVEDIDIVFEQDDGFLPALSQLVSTSKRPIILTTSDEGSVLAQKFINQYDYLTFSPLSSHTLAIWLQLVCLVEGVLVKKDDIGLLLEFNKGDVRKTLLELQYWVISGAQRTININRSLSITNTDRKSITPDLPNEIEDATIVENNCNTFEHQNCLGSFEPFYNNIPQKLDIEKLWWNIPNMLGAPKTSHERFERFSNNKSNIADQSTKKIKQNKNLLDDKLKLVSASKLFDSLALTDILLKKHCFQTDTKVTLKDSLELNERLESYRADYSLSIELAGCLIDGNISEYCKVAESECRINMAVPTASERRWRSKQTVCEDTFREALPLYNRTDRNSVSMDYLPLMRHIARTEENRMANNTKRGNRFRHYFRDFKMKFCTNTCKQSCNIFSVE